MEAPKKRKKKTDNGEGDDTLEKLGTINIKVTMDEIIAQAKLSAIILPKPIQPRPANASTGSITPFANAGKQDQPKPPSFGATK